jgi:hypothetical protein
MAYEEIPAANKREFFLRNRELIVNNRENNGNRIAKPSCWIIGGEATPPLWRNSQPRHPGIRASDEAALP